MGRYNEEEEKQHTVAEKLDTLLPRNVAGWQHGATRAHKIISLIGRAS